MVNKTNNDEPISAEVQRQFLRRTPIKLKQFARLLNDMLTQEVDGLRVKALLSQVTKTRESCVSLHFNSTARLLNQLIKQLSMDSDSLESQKPLLKRLSKRLLEHSSQLDLGVKPQKTAPPAPIEKILPSVLQPDEPEPAKSEQAPHTEEQQVVAEIEEQPDELDALSAFGLYINKGKIIFVEKDASTSPKDQQPLSKQFESLGVECHREPSLTSALEHAKNDPSSIVVAGLELVDGKKVLADEMVEDKNIPLIFIADEDNQENRAKALRNGGTGFMVEPISISTICEQIERLYDLHADTPKRVLVMEDSKAQARYYEKVLMKGPFEVLVVNDPSIFLEALRGFDPESVLMDMQMPDSSGIELTQMIRQMPRYAHLPIIFLSAEENIRKQNQALMSGGTAFIVKPVQKDQLMFMANLYTQRFRDLSPQIDVNPDTNLPYSPQFKQMIAVETARMTRSPSSIALALLHLDEAENLASDSKYSFINSAIQQLALILRKRLRKTDVIGHIDSGKLAVILTSGKQPDWVEILHNVQQQFAELPFHLQHQDKSMTISIGLATLDSNYNPHQWLERSQEALNEAIKQGPSSLKCFDSNEK